MYLFGVALLRCAAFFKPCMDVSLAKPFRISLTEVGASAFWAWLSETDSFASWSVFSVSSFVKVTAELAWTRTVDTGFSKTRLHEHDLAIVFLERIPMSSTRRAIIDFLLFSFSFLLHLFLFCYCCNLSLVL